MTTITTAQADYITSLREDRGWEATKTVDPSLVNRAVHDLYMARYGRRSGHSLPDGLTREEMTETIRAEVVADNARRRQAFIAALSAPIDGISKAEASALIDTLKAGA